MNKKTTLVIAVVFTVISISITMARQEDPFTTIWNTINNLQQQINNLQTQINNIQLIPGPQGPPGISGYEVVTNSKSIDYMSGPPERTITVQCTQGKRILGGGGLAEPSWLLGIWQSHPLTYPDGWSVEFRNDEEINEPITVNISAYAICANVQ